MDLLNIILSWTVSVFFLCGIFLWMRRYEGDLSRRYLIMTCLFGGIVYVLRLLLDGSLRGPSGYSILPVQNLIGGILYIIILYLYPVRVINRDWFSKKFKNFIIFPGLSLIAVLFVIRPYCRELLSFKDIWLNISEWDVIIRLVILFLGILPFTVMLLYIPYNYMKSSAYHGWIMSYTVNIQLIGFLYIIFMLTGSQLASGIHLLVNIYLCASATYNELFVRFKVPDEVREQIAIETMELKPGKSNTDEKSENPLINQIYKLMDEQQIWRNPDLNLMELSSMLNTNRSYLSKAIHDAGYKNYSDMINRRRISEFVSMAKNGEIENVQDAFFSVGFRSRETALRCFKKYVGVLPTDYLRNDVSASEM